MLKSFWEFIHRIRGDDDEDEDDEDEDMGWGMPP